MDIKRTLLDKDYIVCDGNKININDETIDFSDI